MSDSGWSVTIKETLSVREVISLYSIKNSSILSICLQYLQCYKGRSYFYVNIFAETFEPFLYIINLKYGNKHSERYTNAERHVFEIITEPLVYNFFSFLQYMNSQYHSASLNLVYTYT